MRRQKLISLALLLLMIRTGPAAPTELYFGADLSFTTRMLDCGAQYRDSDGVIKNPYAIFKDHGANLIRIQLWTEGNTTGYSTLVDVERGIRNAKAVGLKVLLDFQFSDSWADAEKQVVPAAWNGISHITTNGKIHAARTREQELVYDRAMADTLYHYTTYILTVLNHQDLMPDMVQVGNEINPEILGQRNWMLEPLGKYNRTIDWTRNAMLINAGIKAVRDIGKAASVNPRIMLQIGHSDSVEPWFKDATAAGVKDYDIIGISYYSYHNAMFSMEETGNVIRRLRKVYPGKDVMIVETDYPWTSSPDLLRHSDFSYGTNVLPGHPFTPEGQQKYFNDLARMVVDAGGNGVNVWAPDLVPNSCTERGNGSVNAFFDLDGRVLPAISFMQAGFDEGKKRAATNAQSQ